MSRFEIIQLNNIRLILKTTPCPLRLLCAHWDHCDRSLRGEGGPWRKHRHLFILIFCRCQFWHKLSERRSGICKVLSPTKCLQKERLGCLREVRIKRVEFLLLASNPIGLLSRHALLRWGLHLWNHPAPVRKILPKWFYQCEQPIPPFTP